MTVPWGLWPPIESVPAGSSPVGGPASSTDNAIARWDGASGQLLQNSIATLDDAGNIVVLAAGARDWRLGSTDNNATIRVTSNNILRGFLGAINAQLGTLRGAGDLAIGLDSVSQTSRINFRGFNRITPAVLAADQNDYNPAGWAQCDVASLTAGTPGGAGTFIAITGFEAVAESVGTVDKILFNNDSGDPITIAHENAGSVAANRVKCPGDRNYVWQPGAGLRLLYDTGLSRWRIVDMMYGGSLVQINDTITGAGNYQPPAGTLLIVALLIGGGGGGGGVGAGGGTDSAAGGGGAAGQWVQHFLPWKASVGVIAYSVGTGGAGGVGAANGAAGGNTTFGGAGLATGGAGGTFMPAGTTTLFALGGGSGGAPGGYGLRLSSTKAVSGAGGSTGYAGGGGNSRDTAGNGNPGIGAGCGGGGALTLTGVARDGGAGNDGLIHVMCFGFAPVVVGP